MLDDDADSFWLDRTERAALVYGRHEPQVCAASGWLPTARDGMVLRIDGPARPPR